MSPQEIQNQQLYHDRTVQDWHRNSFPSDWWAIDLDLVGVCNKCRESLYFIESTTNPNKATSILKRLAQKSGTTALIVYHSNGLIMRGKVVFPDMLPLKSEEEISDYLRSVRDDHRCTVNLGLGL